MQEDVLQNLQYFFVSSRPLEPHAPRVLLLAFAHRPPFLHVQGAPVSPEKLKDYSEHHAMTYRATTQLKPFCARTYAPLQRSRAFLCVHRFPRRVRRPEREQRRSNHAPPTALLTPSPGLTQTKIRDTLNNLILKSPQNWQTTIGLPFFQIEGTVVEWDEVKFDGMPLAARARGHERLLTPVLLALRSPPDAAGSLRGRVAHADLAAEAPRKPPSVQPAALVAR